MVSLPMCMNGNDRVLFGCASGASRDQDMKRGSSRRLRRFLTDCRSYYRAALIPGGEKDTDNLRALGFTATTNHGGEGKWWPELSRWFKGRRVFVCCDNDAQGDKHQAAVGAALNGVAAEVSVVRFPELAEGGDVSDFIEQRRKDGLEDAEIKQELIERFKSAPAWGPPAASAGDDWPEPDLSILSHQRLDPPALPLNVFGPYWSQWISDQAEAKSCAPDNVAGGLISGAGVASGKRLLGIAVGRLGRAPDRLGGGSRQSIIG